MDTGRIRHRPRSGVTMGNLRSKVVSPSSQAKDAATVSKAAAAAATNVPELRAAVEANSDILTSIVLLVETLNAKVAKLGRLD